jgi:hypothetical protein
VRTISFRGRVTIAYAIDQEALTILAVLYAGQDIDAILRER